MKQPASEGRIRRVSRCQQLRRCHQVSTKIDKHQEKGQELKDRRIWEVRRGPAWGIWGQAGVSIWNLGREVKRVTVPGPEHRIWAGARDRHALPFGALWAHMGLHWCQRGFIVRNVSRKVLGWVEEAPVAANGLYQGAWRRGEGFIWASLPQCVLQMTKAFTPPNSGLWYRLQWGWTWSQGIFSIGFLRRNPDLQCKWDLRNTISLEDCLQFCTFPTVQRERIAA